MTLGREDLVLANLTVRRAGFTERVEAAAGAGFRGIGLRSRDRDRAHAEGLDDAAIRGLLRRHGVEVCELEVLHTWSPAGVEAEQLHRLADAVGGRCAVAVAEADAGVDAAAERLAALAAAAAEHDLGIALEFLPWTSIPDARTAWEVVRRSGAANAGLLVDAWHHHRGGGDDEGLRGVPPERVLLIQLDDADDPLPDVMEDTLHHRRLPGEGGFDLDHFVRLLDGMGVDAPWSLEVLSREMDALPAREAAARCATAARRVLDAARSAPVPRTEPAPRTEPVT